MKTIETTRFGTLKVDSKDIIKFKEGILGFDNLKKFFIVDPGDQTMILWMQSTEDTSVAFPIIEPQIFAPGHIVELLPSELASLSLESANNATSYAILTIPKNVTEMSANLKAPIVINNQTKEARQIVLQNNKLEMRYEMYSALKTYLSNYSSDDRNRTNDETRSLQKESSSRKEGITTL